MTQIEGIATISENMFRFDGGLPSDLPIIKAQTLQGSLHISENANVEFLADEPQAIAPPVITAVCEGPGYRVKRTTRNYLIQLKVPITESRKTTEDRLRLLLAVVMGEITLDRQELVSMMAA